MRPVPRVGRGSRPRDRLFAEPNALVDRGTGMRLERWSIFTARGDARPPRISRAAVDPLILTSLAYRTKVPLSDSTDVLYSFCLCARDLTWVL